MSESSTIRVAAAQFHIGTDLDENLQTCLRMIRQAAECNPDLIVLPEFCNHLSWYENQEHCDSVSVDLGSDWLAAIGKEAKAVGAYIAVNVTLKRSHGCTGSSVLFSPEGEMLATNDKQVYIGHENDYLERAKEPGPIVDTPIGRIGLYACMDGVINETPRGLGLRGAQILCNSLNSFAPDEGNLHIPVRAAENRVFIVAANKTGPLIPDFLLEPVSEATSIPIEFLSGAGESQIVTPDGTVLALAGKEEEVIYADIDASEALNKVVADGTDVFASRRPELYQAIGDDPETQPVPEYNGKETAKAAVIQLNQAGPDAIDEALSGITSAISQGAELVVLPELFFLSDQSSVDEVSVEQSNELVEKVKAIAGAATVVVSVVQSVNDKLTHAAVAITSAGIVASQPQLHQSARLPWSSLGDEFVTIDLPIGRLGMVTGGDTVYPEVFRMLAIKGCEVVAVPFSAQEAWELRTGLVERAAENRLNLVAATQPSALGNSFINKLHTDFTVMTPWKERPFDGNLTYPVITKAGNGADVLVAEITPKNAENKIVSLGTDVVRGRPWFLADAITGAQ